MKTVVPDYRRYTVAVMLNSQERAALRRLAEFERLPMAQVVRRLIWQAAKAAAVHVDSATQADC